MGRGSTIIKADNQTQAGRWGLSSFELNDVLAEAQQSLADAKREAAVIRDQARHEAEVSRKAARCQGYEAGFEQGRQEGRLAGHDEAFEAARREFAEQQKSLTQACEQIFEEINATRADWQASARQDLIDLAMAIARRVVRAVGQRERDVVCANLEEAVRLMGQRSEITIHVNPQDAASARDFADSLIGRKGRWEHVHVVEDPQVSPGGCRIDWGSGSVDTELETQLQRIESELGVTAKVDE